MEDSLKAALMIQNAGIDAVELSGGTVVTGDHQQRDINGLSMHVLESGFDDPPRPLVLLLHGFPELAWSWRRIMPALADAGYHVVAPDQRGYGRTTGWRAVRRHSRTGSSACTPI